MAPLARGDFRAARQQDGSSTNRHFSLFDFQWRQAWRIDNCRLTLILLPGFYLVNCCVLLANGQSRIVNSAVQTLQRDSVQPEAASYLRGEDPAERSPEGKSHSVCIPSGRKINAHGVPRGSSHCGVADCVEKARLACIADTQGRASVGSNVFGADVSLHSIGVIGKDRHNLIDRRVFLVAGYREVYAKAARAMVRSGGGEIDREIG